MQQAGRAERPHSGHRGELGDPGAGGGAARRRPGGVLQRALGQLRQPDPGHRRSEPPVVEGLGIASATSRDYVQPARRRGSAATTRCCGRSRELAVARQFARIDRYDAHFSSCNRNFHILGERPAQRWCGVCPKCHFVFLALAPFMPKPRLVAIFGRNLLDEPEQTARLRRLAGIPGPQAVRVRGRGPGVARRDGRAGGPPGMARGCAGGALRPRNPAAARCRRTCASRRCSCRSDEHGIPPALWEPPACKFRELEGKERRDLGLRPRRSRRARCIALAPAAAMRSRCSARTTRQRRCARWKIRNLLIETEVDGEKLAAFDVVVKSPGISPYTSPAVDAAVQGTRFIGGTALWFAEHPYDAHDLRHRHQGQEHGHRVDRAPAARRRPVARRWPATSACRCSNCWTCEPRRSTG